MTWLPFFIVTIFVSFGGIASVQAVSGDALQQIIGGQQASGLITNLMGTPLLGSVGGVTRAAALDQTVAITEGVTTGPNDRVEFLWDHRAVIQIQPDSMLLIQASKAGQTELALSRGSVRVALAYGGASTDMVTVQTPSSRVYTRGGLFEVDVRPPSLGFIGRGAAALSPSEPPLSHAPVETVQVREGQVGIEPVDAPTPGGSHLVEAGVLAHIAMGRVEQIEALPKRSDSVLGWADTDRRQAPPALLTQRLVNIHVTHAVEVARVMSTPSVTGDESEPAPGSTVKGTIVATSLGVPSLTPTQAGPTRGPSRPPSASVTSPVPIRPPIQGPLIPTPPQTLTRHSPKDKPGDDEKRGGHAKGHERDQDSSSRAMTSPLPALPAIQIPTVTMLTHGQPGGMNNRDVLKEALDDDKGNRTHQAKGQNRDQDASGSITSPLPMFAGVQLSATSTLTSPQPVGLTSAAVVKDADGGKSGGTHHGMGMEQVSSNPVLTSPLPTLPAMEAPMTTTLAPSQAGGLNSQHLLKDLLDHNKGGGKEKHQGGDRHH